jgi:hypothetical protein
MLERQNLTIEYRGQKELKVPAGTFNADHFAFKLEPPHPAHEELWCMGEDLIPLKIAYPIYNATYELAEFDG